MFDVCCCKHWGAVGWEVRGTEGRELSLGKACVPVFEKTKAGRCLCSHIRLSAAVGWIRKGSFKRRGRRTEFLRTDPQSSVTLPILAANTLRTLTSAQAWPLGEQHRGFIEVKMPERGVVQR